VLALERVPLASVTSLESHLLADAADGRLDQFSLLQAALISGGSTEATDLAFREQQLLSKWRELDEAKISHLTPQQRTQLIMAGMHRLLLTGKYEADCTEVQRTLQSGDYNCVTASVLFLELSRRQGVPATSVAVPGHIYCRTLLDSPQDVQTTCRDWFDILHGRVVSPESQQLLQSIAAKQQHTRTLSDVALVGKVYYNRGVTALETRDYAGAIELLAISLRLDPADAPAKNNLIAAYNNWALELCDAGEYAAAAEKLAIGRQWDPNYGPLLTNDLHVHQKWVLALCERGQHAAALDLLEQGYARRPEANLFDAGRFAVIGMWLKSVAERQDVKRLHSILASTRERYGEHAEWQRQAVVALETTVQKMLKDQQYLEARALLNVARQHHPQAEPLRVLEAELVSTGK
jgi:tetratricopeptide (TPR) repeat protein